jgi:hypothetical protein
MSSPPTHLLVKPEWFDDAPTEPGYYWLVGDPYMGEMGGHFSGVTRPEIRLQFVEISRISNGLLAICGSSMIPLEKWVDGVLKHYENHTQSGLNQIHARGFFAGMSERQIKVMAEQFNSNVTEYPIMRD